MSEDAKEKVRQLLEVFALDSLSPSVDIQPEVILERWCVRRTMFEARLQDFFIGTVAGLGVGRKSTPIQSFNASTRSAVTRSGRIYRLDGEPGIDLDGDHWWKLAFGKQPFEDVTEEYLEKIRAAAN